MKEDCQYIATVFVLSVTLQIVMPTFCHLCFTLFLVFHNAGTREVITEINPVLPLVLSESYVLGCSYLFSRAPNNRPLLPPTITIFVKCSNSPNIPSPKFYIKTLTVFPKILRKISIKNKNVN